MKDFREVIQSGHGTALVYELESLPRIPTPQPPLEAKDIVYYTGKVRLKGSPSHLSPLSEQQTP